jgi:hypothetical protein
MKPECQEVFSRDTKTAGDYLDGLYRRCAVAKYSDVTYSDITKFVKWSSTTDISVLTVNESGVCTALKEGYVEVCAGYYKVTAKALVKVKENI